MLSQNSEFGPLVQEFEKAWSRGTPIPIEEVLERIPVWLHADAVIALLRVEFSERRRRSDSFQLADYLLRFPAFGEQCAAAWKQAAANRDDAGNTPQPCFAPTTNFQDSTGKGEHVASVEPGASCIGRYELQERVGRGGFGEVWRAWDPQLERLVAVKLAHPHRFETEEGVAAFLAEGRRLARVKHPHVVQVLDAGCEKGRPFLVTEFIDGGTLATRIVDKSLPRRAAVLLVAEVADALHACHRSDIVHRDVKPGNILIDAEGRARLADFGLAVSELEQLDERDGVFGTLLYMSPEQLAGESRRIDARTDIYSLGTVMYQLLTGRLPFVARNAREAREMIGLRDARPLRTIDETIDAELERICLKCLLKSVDQRYTAAVDLAADLRAWLEKSSHVQVGGAALSSAQTAVESAPVAAGRQGVSRQRLVAGAGAGLALIAGIVVFVSAPPPRERGSQPDPAKVGGGNSPVPSVAADDSSPADRKAAEWAVRLGGAVRIQLKRRADGPVERVDALDKLPQEPFFLTGLYLERNPRLANEDFDRLAGLAHLTDIELNRSSVNDAGLARLGRMEGLLRLGLAKTQVGDEGAVAIGQLKNLQSLNLQGSYVTDRGLEHFAALSQLVKLELGGTKVSDLGLKNLRSMTELRDLNLDCAAVTDRGLAQIGGLKYLESLSLRFSQVGDEGLSALRPLKRLKALNLASTAVTDAGLPALEPLESLEQLWLGFASISDDGLKTLPPLPKLWHLDVSGTRITDEGLVALKRLPALRQLALSQTKVTGAGLAQLGPLPDLEKLWLFDTPVGDEAVEPLAALLRLNELVLHGTSVSVAGVARLQTQLPDCRIAPP